MPRLPGRLLFWVLLLCNPAAAFGQFQLEVGLSYPSSENSPGGLVAPTGEYVLLSSKQKSPGGASTSIVQLDWLTGFGQFSQPSRTFSKKLFPWSAAWIEPVVYGTQNRFIVAGSTPDGDMALMLVNSFGVHLWTRKIGSSGQFESSACVKVDPANRFILVGNQVNSDGQWSVAAARVDNSGNKLWAKTYTVDGFTIMANSVVALQCNPNQPIYYYITGRITREAGGLDKTFVLCLSYNGDWIWMKSYDLIPPYYEYGACIQGNCSGAAPVFTQLWVAGNTAGTGNSVERPFVMNITSMGIPQWARIYDVYNSGWEKVNHFQFAAGNSLILTGTANIDSTDGPEQAQCLGMHISDDGNVVHWTKIYAMPWSARSQGNRVEQTPNQGFFITGTTEEAINMPHQFDDDILAIRTDPNGVSDLFDSCFRKRDTKPEQVTPTPLELDPDTAALPLFSSVILTPKIFQDSLKSCHYGGGACTITQTAPKAQSGNCFEATFIAESTPSTPGIYTYIWDFDCSGPLPPEVYHIPSNTQTLSHIFPCGGGVFNVCLTIIDPNGTQCQAEQEVIISGECCGTVTGGMSCHPTLPYVYDFAIEYQLPPDIAGDIISCSHVLTSPYPLSNLVYSGNTITGSVTVPATVPTSVGFILQADCICSNGEHTTCTLPFSLATVCCKKIGLGNHVVCKDAASYTVQILETAWPPLQNIYGVIWYVAPKPATGGCPPAGDPAYVPVQNSQTNSLLPLHLIPSAMAGDICVYVAVYLNDGPCTELVTNTATVQRCEPNICSVNGYDYCYTGMSITPGPLTLTFNSPPGACPSVIAWLDPSGNVVQAGGLTYQPTQELTMADEQECFEDIYYTARVIDACGQRDYPARIRLYSGIASIGTLAMEPVEPQFFCPGYEATLAFSPNCAGDPPKWKWYSRPCEGGVFTEIPESGTANPAYNTNELYTSTIYAVVAQNGVCPSDTVEYKIEVKAPLAIDTFYADADPCVEEWVDLTVELEPCTIAGCNTPCVCTHTVNWYRNYTLLGSFAVPSGMTQVSFHYTDPPLPGNYYAVLLADCCPGEGEKSEVVSFLPACVPVVLGPCFICDNEPGVLTVEMVIPPAEPCPETAGCSYTWWKVIGGNWTQIGTGESITITAGGHFRVDSDCDGCLKSLEFDVADCTSGFELPPFECGKVSVQELLPRSENPVRIFPNPTTGEITVEWVGDAPKDARLFVTDPMGRRLRFFTVPDGAGSLNVDLENMPSGMYFVKVQASNRLFTVAKLVKN